MIKITGLTKSFGDKKVLDGLNCTIKTGTIYGLIGANGAGKSTLMRIITRVYTKDSGTIEVDGKKLNDEAISFDEFKKQYGDEISNEEGE